jgi:predicted glutamine amidotransferase
MCRILIILKNIDVEKILKFLNQSIEVKNTPDIDNDRDFNYHKDGYGFVYYLDNKFSIYKSSLMFKDDVNFCFIKENIVKSNFLVGHIRSTKIEFVDDVCYNNTHPFWYEDNYWCHNGSITPLIPSFFMSYIDKKYHKFIKGRTDSELLFYIFLTILDKNKYFFNNEENCWKTFFKLLCLFKNNGLIISANIVYVSSNNIFVSRFINNDEEPPSLYIDNDNFIISSEPITYNYTLIPKNSYIKYNHKNNQKELIVKNL